MPGKMLALESHDVLNQELLILGSHSNEPSMQPVPTNVMGFDEIDPENFDRCFEENLVWKTHREHEGGMRLKEGIHNDADAPATEIDGLLKEFALGVVRLGLKTHGQHDIDSIIGPAISEGRWVIERHETTHYSARFAETIISLPFLNQLVRQFVGVVTWT